MLLTPEEMQVVIYSIPAREPGEDYSRLMEATSKAQLKKVVERLFQPCPKYNEWIYMCPRCVRTMCGEIFIDLDIDVEEWERQALLKEIDD